MSSDKNLDKVFKEWVDDSTNKPEVKEFLHEQYMSYYSFLAFFLKDVIKKK